MTAPTIEQLVARLNDAHKNERHKTRAETLYWFEQYKLLAAAAIVALSQPGQAGVAATVCLVTDKRYPHFAAAEIQLHDGYEPKIGDKLYTTPASAAGDGMAVPAGMVERIESAARRVENGHAPRRIPADPSDVDLVLAEVLSWIKGEPAPFWITSAQASGGEGGDA